MPNLDDWLDYHVNRVKKMKREGMDIGRTESPRVFNCYDPINLQSKFTDFDEDMSELDLRKRFDVIGVMDHFGKSVCAIATRYTGVVPSGCDCTSGENTRRRLGDKDHGVTHHGDTFELTDSQREKISHLTEWDNVLYSRAKIAFAKQVLEIEEDFGVVLCDEPVV
jgi:hypothetical protein